MRRKARIKPSKTSSAIGTVIGGCFVIFGISLLSSSGSNPFIVAWTIGAAGITIYYIVNLFSDKAPPMEEIDFDDTTFPAEHSNETERLRELEKLKAENLITEQEYEQKRKEIINKL